MRLKWSAFALADRDDIFTHIEAESPRAAAAVDEHIAQAVLRLVEFPEWTPWTSARHAGAGHLPNAIYCSLRSNP